MAGPKQVRLDTCIHAPPGEDGDAISQEIKLEEPYRGEAITFPFEWKYAVITELSQEEKHVMRHKGCDLCNQKKVEFQKVCSGMYKSFLCRSCAENYVRGALRLNIS